MFVTVSSEAELQDVPVCQRHRYGPQDCCEVCGAMQLSVGPVGAGLGRSAGTDLHEPLGMCCQHEWVCACGQHNSSTPLTKPHPAVNSSVVISRCRQVILSRSQPICQSLSVPADIWLPPHAVATPHMCSTCCILGALFTNPVASAAPRLA